MLTSILIATFFSIGFFVESIIGFGGGLIAYSFLGFFIDIKKAVLAGLYIGTCSSTYIAYTDFKSFNKKILLKSAPICLFGTIIGVTIFSKFSSDLLSIIFGLLLIFLAAKLIFFDQIAIPKILKKKLLFIGGISQGAFGIGGPFFVNGLKEDFKNKSELRSTMAVFFVIFNLVRIFQLFLNNQIKAIHLNEIWWVIIPIFVAIKLGHKVHIKADETIIKKMIALITVLGGVKFLL